MPKQDVPPTLTLQYGDQTRYGVPYGVAYKVTAVTASEGEESDDNTDEGKILNNLTKEEFVLAKLQDAVVKCTEALVQMDQRLKHLEKLKAMGML